jgi:hypothetical protein
VVDPDAAEVRVDSTASSGVYAYVVVRLTPVGSTTELVARFAASRVTLVVVAPLLVTLLTRLPAAS